MCSSFIEAVESVDCCRLLCAIESSRFVDSVVVADVDCCRLHCLL